MSRTHARVYRRGENYLVEDLGSRNGTFVKVRDKARIPLHARIWIGSEYFSVVEGAE
jgi:pSer/pThr/pTyr-binding forkhead associated (FHA) protein